MEKIMEKIMEKSHGENYGTKKKLNFRNFF